MKKIIADHVVEDIQYPVEGNYIIQLKSPVTIPLIKPGNFAQILINNSPGVFLRRPFSILDVDYKNNLISFYIKIIGKGTKQLGTNNIGNKVNIIYPLGNSFSIPKAGKKVLMVGGGSGIAPFILLGKELRKNNVQATFLLGGRSRKDIFLIERFNELGEVLITTEDGSYGDKGLVTDHSIFASASIDYDKIYTCGPDPMMKAIGKIAKKHKTDCEVSLENMMACGFGACLCCVTETIEGNKRVCMEGPVFNANYIKWQI